MVWTAQTQLPPIFVSIDTFGGQAGLIVTLSDSGFLQLSYLGTVPAKNQISSGESKQEMSTNEMFAEHGRLLKKIMQQESEEQTEPTDSLTVGA